LGGFARLRQWHRLKTYDLVKDYADEERVMPVPDFQGLMLPVLRTVADGELSASETRERVADELGLSESDLAEMLPSGRAPTFANRVAWATFFMQRAGLLERPRRGVYRITEEGRRVLGEPPERIDMRFLERYPGYVEWRRRSAGAAVRDAQLPSGALPLTDTGATPEEQIERSHTALVAALETDLLDRVREKPPDFFEKLIVDLLIAMGYGGGREEMGKAVGRAGDAGIDHVGIHPGRSRVCRADQQTDRSRRRHRACPTDGRAWRGCPHSSDLRDQDRRRGLLRRLKAGFTDVADHGWPWSAPLSRPISRGWSGSS
jgi:Mrr N-terminal domain